MWPVIHIADWHIESFKLFIVLGFLSGSLVLFYQNSKQDYRLVSHLYLFITLIFMLLGGLIGAQIHYFIYHPNWSHLMDFPGDSSWHKGLIVGILIYLIAFRIQGVPFLRSLDFLAPAIPLGHGIGRIGCFLAGDGCYGVPTNLPWGMSFPEGAAPTLIKVHPVPLYETIILSGIFMLLLAIKKRRMKPGSLFAIFTLLVGTERILLEELRLNSPVFAGLTEPQLTYGILMFIGISILLFQYRNEIKKRIISVVDIKPIARKE